VWLITAAVLILILGAVVFLKMPYSPTKAKFISLTEAKVKGASMINEVFAEADIAGLPAPVQKYFKYCAYIGTPKMSYMRAALHDVVFVMSDIKTIKIDYEQFNLVKRPERFALISSSIMGVPFEGLDSYDKGRGGMKGSLAKAITLFDQKGDKMDRACLVTWLAECLMVPNAALQDFVIWETVDDTHAKAAISWENESVSGIFTFSPKGELLSFRTEDRTAIDMDSKETAAGWSAYFCDYKVVGEILQPSYIQSVWHYDDGDCIYFNENRSGVSIQYQ